MDDSHSHSKYKATQYTSCKHRAANTHIQSNAFAFFKTAVFVSLRDSEGPIQKQMAKFFSSVLADDDASGGVNHYVSLPAPWMCQNRPKKNRTQELPTFDYLLLLYSSEVYMLYFSCTILSKSGTSFQRIMPWTAELEDDTVAFS